MHRRPCRHLSHIVTFAWYERGICRNHMWTDNEHSIVYPWCFHSSNKTAASLTSRHGGKVRHIKTVYPLHSSSLPLSCANYVHASDIRLQTHTFTHRLIKPTTLSQPRFGVWWKPPLHDNECQRRGEVSTARNRIKLTDAAWGQQLIN